MIGGEEMGASLGRFLREAERGRGRGEEGYLCQCRSEDMDLKSWLSTK